SRQGFERDSLLVIQKAVPKCWSLPGYSLGGLAGSRLLRLAFGLPLGAQLLALIRRRLTDGTCLEGEHSAKGAFPRTSVRASEGHLAEARRLDDDPTL